MDCTCIPLSELPHTSRLFRDYVSGAAETAQFFPHSYRRPESFRKAASELRYADSLRSSVADVLAEQNRQFGASPEALKNLGRLRQPGCCAVVTGQQVGLFTGPAFALYKALTAIKLARHLSEQGIDAVPVFWLATEDHDLDEVNHSTVPDREGRLQRIGYAERPAVENSPAGALRLTEAIVPLLDALRQLLPETDAARGVVSLLGECYRPGETLGGAFGRFFARLLAGHGVLVVDPLEPRLHALSAKVFQAAVAEQPALLASLLDRNQQLTAAGYHAQVRVAEQSTLLFLYEEGKRCALRWQQGQFHSSSGSVYSPEQLLNLVESDPARFSPNVLLRPVMQDWLLPTVACVGGPSEIAYLAQAAPVYERILGRMPVVVPRASLTLLDPASNRLLGKYGLGLLEVCAGRTALREKMAAKYFSADLTQRFSAATAELQKQMQAIQQDLAQLDPTLADAAKNSTQKMLYQLSSLERKAAAAVQAKSDQLERDAQRLEHNLYPEKAMQERTYSGVAFLARYGTELLGPLYERISPLPTDHQILAV